MRDVKLLDICLKRISNTIYDTHEFANYFIIPLRANRSSAVFRVYWNFPVCLIKYL